MLGRHMTLRQLNHMPQQAIHYKMIFESVEDELNGDIEARRILPLEKSKNRGAGPSIGLWSPVHADDATPLASARRELLQYGVP
jgi:hypothetical protein